MTMGQFRTTAMKPDCARCGLPVEEMYYISPGGYYHPGCHKAMTATREPPLGWMCPRCGQVYSPFVAQCGNCRPATSAGDTSAVRT